MPRKYLPFITALLTFVSESVSMSSRDVGPALPPHMRRSHGNTLEDTGSSSHRIQDEERSRNRFDDRRKHKVKYDDRERVRDKDRVSYNSEKYRDRDRSSYHTSERDYRRTKGRREAEERDSSRNKSQRDVRKQNIGGSSKCSKRSKTDRTYNTDTEESSDGSSSNNQEWAKDCNSDNSDSEPECATSKSPVKDSGTSDRFQIGPALPPHLSNQASNTVPVSDSSDSEASPEISKLTSKSKESPSQGMDIGPALPPHLHKNVDDAIGPALPPSLHAEVKIDEDIDDDASIGPVLPAHLLNKKQPAPSLHKTDSNQIGPALPPHLRNHQSSDSETELNAVGPALPPRLKEKSLVGPALPPGIDLDKFGKISDASSDDEVVGPLLPEEMVKSGKNYKVQAQLERNAAAIKRKMEEKDLPDTSTQREEWMLELPPEGTVDLGLGPRSFRARGAPEKGADRSMWTDTPADKVRKEEEAKRRFELGISSTEDVKKAGISKEISSKDKAMESIVKKHKRSKESLLDAHQKKLEKEKKKKEKAGAKQERRPFNRETDLKANVFDDAQKKAIYKKAQLLDTRFSRGETKYL